MSPERGNPRRVARMTARHSRSHRRQALKTTAKTAINNQGGQRDEPGAG